MTDTRVEPDDMGSSDPRPEAVSGSSVPDGPRGTAILLLSGESDRDLCAEAALSLCTAWAEGGRRIVLADLHLEQPLLSGELSPDEVEGVADLLLYGVSLGRIARPVQDGLFYIVPAGTYAPDIGRVYGHPRWARIIAGCRDTGATLLLFAPVETDALAELREWAMEAILIGSAANQQSRNRLAALGIELVAVLGTRDPIGPSVPMGVPNAREDQRRALEPTAPGSEIAPSVTMALRRDINLEDDLELPPPPRRPASTRRRSVFVTGLLLAAAALIVVYLVAAFRPELLSDGRAGATPEWGEQATREAELLPYSVQVRAFTSLPAAREQMLDEQRRLSSGTFFISPEEIQGVLYYRVLAGLLADTASALRLRDELVQAGAIDVEDAIATYGLLQFTPLAFDLGEFSTREEAMARSDSLLLDQVPSYMATVRYSDGTRRWQLYGGAYRDNGGAVRMADLLEIAGMSGELTVRAGDPSPTFE